MHLHTPAIGERHTRGPTPLAASLADRPHHATAVPQALGLTPLAASLADRRYYVTTVPQALGLIPLAASLVDRPHHVAAVPQALGLIPFAASLADRPHHVTAVPQALGLTPFAASLPDRPHHVTAVPQAFATDPNRRLGGPQWSSATRAETAVTVNAADQPRRSKMISKTVTNFALAAALATGIFAINGTAQAGDWADAVSASKSVSGERQSADRSTAWTNALRVENVKGTPQIASSEPYGFLEQARAEG